jgi:hypothetical protein
LTASVIDRESAVHGGKLKFVALIEEPTVIEKLLKHIGLDPPSPPVAPARRRVELFDVVEAAWESAGISRGRRGSTSAMARG